MKNISSKQMLKSNFNEMSYFKTWDTPLEYPSDGPTSVPLYFGI